MRLRQLAPLAAVAAAAGAFAVVPALAADQSVQTSGNNFSPKTVTIDPGDKVTWSNADGGFHNVRFVDGQYESPKDPSPTWASPVERTFEQPGSYRYFCEAHGSEEGGGMTGTVVVRDPAATPTPTATPTRTPTPTPTASPTPTPAPGTSPTPTPSPGASPTPTPGPGDPGDAGDSPPGADDPSFKLKVTAKRFCIRDCKKPGVFVGIDLDATEPAVLRGTLRRVKGGKARPFGKLRIKAKPGRRTVRILKTAAGKRLLPGRYVLRLSAPGGEAHKVRFRVTR